MASTIQPSYLMRMDFSSDKSDNGIEAIHMQASYANLKNLQRELQQALNDLQGVHAQRLTRYIV